MLNIDVMLDIQEVLSNEKFVREVKIDSIYEYDKSYDYGVDTIEVIVLNYKGIFIEMSRHGIRHHFNMHYNNHAWFSCDDYYNIYSIFCNNKENEILLTHLKQDLKLINEDLNDEFCEIKSQAEDE